MHQGMFRSIATVQPSTPLLKVQQDETWTHKCVTHNARPQHMNSEKLKQITPLRHGLQEKWIPCPAKIPVGLSAPATLVGKARRYISKLPVHDELAFPTHAWTHQGHLEAANVHNKPLAIQASETEIPRLLEALTVSSFFGQVSQGLNHSLQMLPQLPLTLWALWTLTSLNKRNEKGHGVRTQDLKWRTRNSQQHGQICKNWLEQKLKLKPCLFPQSLSSFA